MRNHNLNDPKLTTWELAEADETDEESAAEPLPRLPSRAPRQQQQQQQQQPMAVDSGAGASMRRVTSEGSVTADDVEAAVERAEALWAKALNARQRADSLSGEAETLADEARRRPRSRASSETPRFRCPVPAAGEHGHARADSQA